MNVNVRKLGVHLTDHMEIKIKSELGIDTALDQHLCPAQIHQFLDFLENLIYRKRVRFRIARPAVERAEITIDKTGVRITDVAVHNKSDHPVRMKPIAHRGRRLSQTQQIAGK